MAPTATLPPNESTVTFGKKVTWCTAYPTPDKTMPGKLDASKLIFVPNQAPKKVPEPNSPEVWAQNTCTDHMITCKWTLRDGWHSPKLEPYGPFSLMPTASVLHYATECFEGLKLYRGFDGRLRLFRPDCNAQRMLQSATRIALPSFDPDQLQILIEKLCAVDGPKWLPATRPGSFLYLRPTMIGTADNLGVQKPKEALLYVIACCFPSFDTLPGSSQIGHAAVTGSACPASASLKLLASNKDTIRAWPGGFGFAKLGSNYGPSLMAQGEAREKGFDQVLWLLGEERLVTEAGASNFFVVWRTREGQLQLVTAPLTDRVILDGITRRSVLALTKQRLRTNAAQPGKRSDELEPLEVVERPFTIHEIEDALMEDRLVEAFVTGTAFFISPVSYIGLEGIGLEVPRAQGTAGDYTAAFKTWLWQIMYGEQQHEWGRIIQEEYSP